jgi:hypothetical protein
MLLLNNSGIYKKEGAIIRIISEQLKSIINKFRLIVQDTKNVSVKSINSSTIKLGNNYITDGFATSQHSHPFLKVTDTAFNTYKIGNYDINHFSLFEHYHYIYVKNPLNILNSVNSMYDITAKNLSPKTHMHNNYVLKSKLIFNQSRRMYADGEFRNPSKELASAEHLHPNFIEREGKSKFAAGIRYTEYQQVGTTITATGKVKYPSEISPVNHSHDNIYLTKEIATGIFMPKSYYISSAEGFMIDSSRYKIRIFRYIPESNYVMATVPTFPADFMSTSEFEQKYLNRTPGSVFKYMQPESFAYGIDRNTLRSFMSSQYPEGDLNHKMYISLSEMYNQPLIPGNES